MELELTSTKQKIMPGMAISVEYTVTEAGKIGTFSNFGTATKDDIPVPPGAAPDGTAYFVCVGYDYDGSYKFVCDRVLQTGISWEEFNRPLYYDGETFISWSGKALSRSAGFCSTSGVDVGALTGISGSLMRLMRSDVANNIDSRDNSEWDRIIFRGPIGNTEISAAHIGWWNYGNVKSWMMDTPPSDGTMGDRVVRGAEAKDYSLSVTRYAASDAVSDDIGFRPVLTIPDIGAFLYIKGGRVYGEGTRPAE